MAKILVNNDVYVRNRYGVLRRVFIANNEFEDFHIAAIEDEVKRGELDYFDFEKNEKVDSPFEKKVASEKVEEVKPEPVKEEVVEEPEAEVAEEKVKAKKK